MEKVKREGPSGWGGGRAASWMGAPNGSSQEVKEWGGGVGWGGDSRSGDGV